MQKLEFINIAYNMLDKKAYDDLCMDEEEIKSYENGERDPYIVFEGDPDYMIDDNGVTTYFCIIGNRVYYISDDYDLDIEKLKDFCEAQDPKISIGGWNKRLESDKRKYFDENTREAFESYIGLKIAYRGGCGYSYTLFKYE